MTSSMFYGGSLEPSARPKWFYVDEQENLQGPFAAELMESWYNQGKLSHDLLICAVPQADGDPPPRSGFSPLSKLLTQTQQPSEVKPATAAPRSSFATGSRLSIDAPAWTPSGLQTSDYTSTNGHGFLQDDPSKRLQATNKSQPQYARPLSAKAKGVKKPAGPGSGGGPGRGSAVGDGGVPGPALNGRGMGAIPSSGSIPGEVFPAGAGQDKEALATRLFSANNPNAAQQPKWRYITPDGDRKGPESVGDMVKMYMQQMTPKRVLVDSTLVCGIKDYNPQQLPGTRWYKPLGKLMNWVARGNNYPALTKKDLARGSPPADFCQGVDDMPERFDGGDGSTAAVPEVKGAGSGPPAADPAARPMEHMAVGFGRNDGPYMAGRGPRPSNMNRPSPRPQFGAQEAQWRPRGSIDVGPQPGGSSSQLSEQFGGLGLNAMSQGVGRNFQAPALTGRHAHSMSELEESKRWMGEEDKAKGPGGMERRRQESRSFSGAPQQFGMKPNMGAKAGVGPILSPWGNLDGMKMQPQAPGQLGTALPFLVGQGQGQGFAAPAPGGLYGAGVSMAAPPTALGGPTGTVTPLNGFPNLTVNEELKKAALRLFTADAPAPEEYPIWLVITQQGFRMFPTTTIDMIQLYLQQHKLVAEDMVCAMSPDVKDTTHYKALENFLRPLGLLIEWVMRGNVYRPVTGQDLERGTPEPGWCAGLELLGAANAITMSNPLSSTPASAQAVPGIGGAMVARPGALPSTMLGHQILQPGLGANPGQLGPQALAGMLRGTTPMQVRPMQVVPSAGMQVTSQGQLPSQALYGAFNNQQVPNQFAILQAGGQYGPNQNLLYGRLPNNQAVLLNNNQLMAMQRQGMPVAPQGLPMAGAFVRPTSRPLMQYGVPVGAPGTMLVDAGGGIQQQGQMNPSFAMQQPLLAQAMPQQAGQAFSQSQLLQNTLATMLAEHRQLVPVSQPTTDGGVGPHAPSGQDAQSEHDVKPAALGLQMHDGSKVLGAGVTGGLQASGDTQVPGMGLVRAEGSGVLQLASSRQSSVNYPSSQDSPREPAAPKAPGDPVISAPPGPMMGDSSRAPQMMNQMPRQVDPNTVLGQNKGAVWGPFAMGSQPGVQSLAQILPYQAQQFQQFQPTNSVPPGQSLPGALFLTPMPVAPQMQGPGIGSTSEPVQAGPGLFTAPGGLQLTGFAQGPFNQFGQGQGLGQTLIPSQLYGQLIGAPGQSVISLQQLQDAAKVDAGTPGSGGVAQPGVAGVMTFSGSMGEQGPNLGVPAPGTPGRSPSASAEGNPVQAEGGASAPTELFTGGPKETSPPLQWWYLDDEGQVEGPFAGAQMAVWFVAGRLPSTLKVCGSTTEWAGLHDQGPDKALFQPLSVLLERLHEGKRYPYLGTDSNDPATSEGKGGAPEAAPVPGQLSVA